MAAAASASAVDVKTAKRKEETPEMRYREDEQRWRDHSPYASALHDIECVEFNSDLDEDGNEKECTESQVYQEESARRRYITRPMHTAVQIVTARLFRFSRCPGCDSQYEIFTNVPLMYPYHAQMCPEGHISFPGSSQILGDRGDQLAVSDNWRNPVQLFAAYWGAQADEATKQLTEELSRLQLEDIQAQLAKNELLLKKQERIKKILRDVKTQPPGKPFWEWYKEDDAPNKKRRLAS